MLGQDTSVKNTFSENEQLEFHIPLCKQFSESLINSKELRKLDTLFASIIVRILFFLLLHSLANPFLFSSAPLMRLKVYIIFLSRKVNLCIVISTEG